MSGVFLVFGMPRSGTAWISCFLTYGDRTCAHELSRERKSVDAVLEALYSAPTDYTGNSDSGMLAYWRQLGEVLPLAPRVYIHRPAAECAKSLEAATGIAASDFLPGLRTIENELRAAQEEKPGLALPFASLFEEAAARSLWSHCGNGSFPVGHWRKMRTLRVVQDPRLIVEAASDIALNVVTANLQCSSPAN